MTDDELEARLRRLDARPEKDAAFWDGDGRGGARRRRARDARGGAAGARLAASAGGVGGGLLAMAAALALWLRAHHAPPAAHEPVGDTFHVFEDLEPGELIEELSPADVERVAKAFDKKGA